MSDQEGTSVLHLLLMVFIITGMVKLSLWLIDMIALAIAGEDNFISRSCVFVRSKIDGVVAARKKAKKKANDKKEGRETVECNCGAPVKEGDNPLCGNCHNTL